MKKLFLASSGLEYIKQFVGFGPSEVKMLFIPTAGNLDKDAWWIDKDRDVLGKMGFQITELDISKASVDEIKKDQEFGLVLTPPIDLKAGDIMSATTIEP